MAHSRESKPDSGLGVQVEALETFSVSPRRSDHARAQEEVAKSRFPLKIVVSKSQKAQSDALSIESTPSTTLAWEAVSPVCRVVRVLDLRVGALVEL